MQRFKLLAIVLTAAMLGCANVRGTGVLPVQDPSDGAAALPSAAVPTPRLGPPDNDTLSNAADVSPTPVATLSSPVEPVVFRPLVQPVNGHPIAVHANASITKEPPTAELIPPGAAIAAPIAMLHVEQFVTDVLNRNPSVAATIAAWRAAAAQYPQAIALNDPTLDVALGPASWGSNEVDSAYMVMASQQLPWPGKRRLRGAIVNSQAAATASEIGNTRLRLAEAARLAFYDYYAAHHELQLNVENIRRTREFRETAAARLRANLVTQQDVLQADVELALLDRRRSELDRQLNVAQARINTLLVQDAMLPLPPPPVALPVLADVVPPDVLRELAIPARPDLAGLSAQIRGEEAAIALAEREFYPDAELYARYDAFWQEQPLRPVVGMNVNVPLYRSKRYAALREAQSRRQRYRGEYERLVYELSNEIQAAYERLAESRRTALLYRERIIPAAEQNVESALAGYVAGRVDFLRLIEAQRQHIELREQQVETEADVYRRLAELQRVSAVPLETILGTH